MTDLQTGAESPAAPPRAPARSNPRRDLALFGLFLAGLALACAAGYSWLVGWKARADALPVLRYEQPVWSDTGNALAYLRLEGDARQLWAVDRFGDEHHLLADLGTNPVRIVGWLENEEHVVLQTEGPQTDGIVLLDVRGDGSGGRRLRFPGEGLRFVGRGARELLFEKPLEEGAGLELLGWTPDTDRLRPLVTIPSAPGEEVRVEQVAPAPDGHHLALVLRAHPPDGPLGVWVYDRDTGQLQWTTISVEGARAMRADWSPDSREIVAAAWLEDRSEIFLVARSLDEPPTRLRTAAASQPLIPMWPRDGRRVLLLAGPTVLEADLDRRKAEAVMNPGTLGLQPEELAISPVGGVAAFHVRDGETDDLYIAPLRQGRPEAVAVPGQRRDARRSLLYTVADGMQYAISRLFGPE